MADFARLACRAHRTALAFYVDTLPPAQRLPSHYLCDRQRSDTTFRALRAYSFCSRATAGSHAEELSEPSSSETEDLLLVHKLDLRVGIVLSVKTHPEADDLYVEDVDVGEPEARTIASGLRRYTSADDLNGKAVVVVCNLKARKMRGITSQGMLLCASNSDHTLVELLTPSAGKPGDRVHFGNREPGDVASPNQVQKKKIWEACQPHLATDEKGIAHFKGHKMQTSSGSVTCGLQQANIS